MPDTVKTVAGGLEQPWSLAFLPDGMLVMARAIRFVTCEGSVVAADQGRATVFTIPGQKPGLLDITVRHPIAEATRSCRNVHSTQALAFQAASRWMPQRREGTLKRGVSASA